MTIFFIHNANKLLDEWNHFEVSTLRINALQESIRSYSIHVELLPHLSVVLFYYILFFNYLLLRENYKHDNLYRMSCLLNVLHVNIITYVL